MTVFFSFPREETTFRFLYFYVPSFKDKDIHSNLDMPKLCEYLNCKKRASYGYFYEKPKRCPTHGRLVLKMKPQYAVCRCGNAQPTFNEPGETRAVCCSLCKTKTMVNVKHKKCKCGNAIPIFNEPGETRGI